MKFWNHNYNLTPFLFSEHIKFPGQNSIQFGNGGNFSEIRVFFPFKNQRKQPKIYLSISSWHQWGPYTIIEGHGSISMSSFWKRIFYHLTFLPIFTLLKHFLETFLIFGKLIGKFWKTHLIARHWNYDHDVPLVYV